jgi:molybdate transport system ATP-binding protein
MLDVDVRRRFGDFLLKARFQAAGGVTALFGRSGSGKTSLVNLLAGLERPEAGRIAIDDQVLFDKDRGIDVPPERRRIGYVFQDARLFPHLSVRANLTYGMRLVPVAERHQDFHAVVALLGLEPLLQRRPRALSGGEKQRVAIGRALLASPRLLLMDEPLASLDAPRKEEILPLIERLRDELAVPVVYVSHVMEEVVRLADTLVLLSDGAVAAVGGVEELSARLDLRPVTGRHEAGAVLAVTVAGHDAEFGLSRLEFLGNSLLVPRLDLEIGATLRIRIRARDVALALEPPAGTSILNVIGGVVREIEAGDGPRVDVLIDAGAPLIARITRRSAHALGLEPGKTVFALIKAVAIDRQSLGGRGARART